MAKKKRKQSDSAEFEALDEPLEDFAEEEIVVDEDAEIAEIDEGALVDEEVGGDALEAEEIDEDALVAEEEEGAVVIGDEEADEVVVDEEDAVSGDDDFDDGDEPDEPEDDREGVGEEEEKPRAKVTAPTMILTALNVLAACAFAFLLLMDYEKRQKWSYAVFLHDLAFVGLPLEEEDDRITGSQVVRDEVEISPKLIAEAFRKRATGANVPESEFPMVEEVLRVPPIKPSELTDKILNDMFKGVGAPSQTLEEEVKKVKGKLFSDIEAAAVKFTETAQSKSAAEKQELLKHSLLPMASTTDQVEAVAARIQAVSDGNQLDAMLLDAVQRKILFDLLRIVQMNRPWPTPRIRIEAKVDDKGVPSWEPLSVAVRPGDVVEWWIENLDKNVQAKFSLKNAHGVVFTNWQQLKNLPDGKQALLVLTGSLPITAQPGFPSAARGTAAVEGNVEDPALLKQTGFQPPAVLLARIQLLRVPAGVSQMSYQCTVHKSKMSGALDLTEAPFYGSLEQAVELPLDLLKSMVEQRFDDVLKAQATYAGIKRESFEKRENIAFLLVAVSHLRIPITRELLYPRQKDALTRTEVVLGQVEYVKAVKSLVQILEDLAEEAKEKLVVDREGADFQLPAAADSVLGYFKGIQGNNPRTIIVRKAGETKDSAYPLDQDAKIVAPGGGSLKVDFPVYLFLKKDPTNKGQQTVVTVLQNAEIDGGFVGKYREEVARILELVANIQSRKKILADLGKQLADTQQLLSARKDDLDALKKQLWAIQKQTVVYVEELKNLERQLFEAQRQFAFVADENKKLEEQVRELEAKLGGTP